MPKHFAHHFDGNPSSQQECRCRVPQIMKANVWQTRTLDQSGPPLTSKAGRLDRLSDPIRKDQIPILPRFPEPCPFLLLPLTVVPQRLHDPLW